MPSPGDAHRSTRPPAAMMRRCSAAMQGSWSRVSGTATVLSLPPGSTRASTARESPARRKQSKKLNVCTHPLLACCYKQQSASSETEQKQNRSHNSEKHSLMRRTGHSPAHAVVRRMPRSRQATAVVPLKSLSTGPTISRRWISRNPAPGARASDRGHHDDGGAAAAEMTVHNADHQRPVDLQEPCATHGPRSHMKIHSRSGGAPRGFK